METWTDYPQSILPLPSCWITKQFRQVQRQPFLTFGYHSEIVWDQKLFQSMACQKIPEVEWLDFLAEERSGFHILITSKEQAYQIALSIIMCVATLTVNKGLPFLCVQTSSIRFLSSSFNSTPFSSKPFFQSNQRWAPIKDGSAPTESPANIQLNLILLHFLFDKVC